MKAILVAFVLSFSAVAAYAVSACTQPGPSNTIIDYTGLPSNCTTNSTTPCKANDTLFLSAVAIGYSFGCEGHTYFWDFGDGTIGSGQSVMHPYPLPGTYIVTLTLKSALSPTTVLTQTINVISPLPALDRGTLLLLALILGGITFVRLR